jgi:hypothetical protein
VLLGAVRLTFIDPSAKFIGKLDDIPAFADAATGMEGEDEDVEDADADNGNDGGGEGPGPDVETRTTEGDGPSLLARPVDEGDAVEPGAFDDDEDPVAPKGLGSVEIGLIGVAIVAVLGLAIGVAVLVMGY